MKQSHAIVPSLMSDKTNVASGIKNKIWSRQHSSNSGSACPFNWDISRLRIQEAPHVNKVPTQLSSFCSYSWIWTNCWQYLHTLDTNDAGSLTFWYDYKEAVHLSWQYQYKLEMMWGTQQKITGPLLKNSIHNFAETSWKTISLIYFIHICTFCDNMNQSDRNGEI
jgi:hypothetical protein